MIRGKKKVFAIVGSASENSANKKLVQLFANLTEGYFDVRIYNELKQLPHFDSEQSVHDPPQAIVSLRREIDDADGVLICTPEYVFSIPSGLKNAVEWCVATTVFVHKPTALLTASANGKKGHKELQLIMKTLMAKCIPDTTLLISGIKGKMDSQGKIIDRKIQQDLMGFINAFRTAMNNNILPQS